MVKLPGWGALVEDCDGLYVSLVAHNRALQLLLATHRSEEPADRGVSSGECRDGKQTAYCRNLYGRAEVGCRC